jgi:ankyrin repeat protein
MASSSWLKTNSKWLIPLVGAASAAGVLLVARQSRDRQSRHRQSRHRQSNDKLLECTDDDDNFINLPQNQRLDVSRLVVGLGPLGRRMSARELLRRAIIAEDEDSITKLLQNEGLDLDINGPLFDRGLSPLSLAASLDKPKAAAVLLTLGADPSGAVSKEGLWAIHYAAVRSAACTSLLVVAGANIEVQEKHTGMRLRPLALALEHMNEEAAYKLLAAGADINAPDVVGMPPLHSACVRNRAKTVEFILKQQGLDSSATNGSGSNALHLAASCLHADVVRLLLSARNADNSASFDLESQDGDDNTALSRLCLRPLPPIEYRIRLSETAIALIEAGSIVDPVVRPRTFTQFDTLFEDIITALLYPHSTCLEPDMSSPLPPYRRTLRLITTMYPVGWFTRRRVSLQARTWSADAQEREDRLIESSRQATESKEEQGAREKAVNARLSLLREDAWKRRRHLCLGRAPLGKPAASKAETANAKAATTWESVLSAIQGVIG